jgi:metallophosphoesterase superfamily enzyme
MRATLSGQMYIAENVLLDGRLALFHELERWLVVSDLHFGYELSQRTAGRLVPLWGMSDITNKLEQLLCDYRPDRLIILGDLVHDRRRRRRPAIQSKVGQGMRVDCDRR